MINNWDVISRQDPQTRHLHYTLVTDGTEHDARLIAKKLQGFVQEPTAAVAPYVYAFELPENLDEETLAKIRTAADEAAQQSRKVNEFVPGGVLGDPLFHAGQTTGEANSSSFGTVNPSDSFFQTPVPNEPEANAPAEANPPEGKEASGEITINDKDMLIKDMEGTLLDKMPLEDIFSAETKYDMFLDLENQQLVKNSQIQREQKMGNLADGKDSLEETFNVFEQKIKDQTCIIDLEDLNTITDRLAQKDMEFVKHANTTPPAPVPEELRPSEPDAVVSPAGESLPAASQEKIEQGQSLPDIPGLEGAQINLSVQTPSPQTQEEQDIIRAAVPEPPVAQPLPQDEKTFSFSQLETKTDNVDRSPSPTMFTVRQAGDNTPVQTEVTEQNAFETAETADFSDDVRDPLPEEVNLTNTIAPTDAKAKTFVAPHPGDDLPEITIRGKKIDSLEKTFNLETTLNTEIMRTQYEKSFHNPQDPPPMHHPKPQAAREAEAFPSGVLPPDRAGESEQIQTKNPQPNAEEKSESREPLPEIKIAGGTHTSHTEPKPESAAQAPTAAAPNQNQEIQTEPKSGENTMDENIEEKTTFRIRRKIAPQEAAPQPPAPPAPAAPRIAPQTTPVQPAVPPVPSASAQSAPANTIIEKTKTIDHSIELPLSELKKHNWPLEIPMVPTYTLENMVISVNRFAHATAISVIENPGRLYNPLVFHGPTGTGKTHFLNAMAYAFSKKYGQENIFMTNGVRLSRGIQRYVMEGNIEKFEKFMDTVKVLLIDDIHLLAINEQNRTHISALLNKFLREQKQIVITSKYPPESLEKLEQLIRFKLDSGWISELKPTGGSTHFKIVKKMLLDNGVDLNDAQITSFFGGAHMTLGTITRSIRRLKVLENLMYPHMAEQERSQANIFEKLLATTGEDQFSQLLSKDPSDITAISTVGNGEWGRVGFFYPQNSSHMMPWMVYALQQRAKELGIDGGFEIAVRSSYSTDNIISSAFKIANLCDNKKLKGAVILGPALTVCDPSVRENFYDILTHMLEIMLIRCGIINAEDAKAPSTYVKVISELLR